MGREPAFHDGNRFTPLSPYLDTHAPTAVLDMVHSPTAAFTTDVSLDTLGGERVFSLGAHTLPHEVPKQHTPSSGLQSGGTILATALCASTEGVSVGKAPHVHKGGTPQHSPASCLTKGDPKLFAAVTLKSGRGRVKARKGQPSHVSHKRLVASNTPSVTVNATTTTTPPVVAPDSSQPPASRSPPAGHTWQSHLPADPALAPAHTSSHLPPPPPLPTTPDYYTLTPETYEEVVKCVNRQPTLDLLGLPISNIPSHVTATRLSTLQAALTCNLKDQSVLIFAPEQHTHLFLDNYLAAKQLRQPTLSATLILLRSQVNAFKHKLVGWHRVARLRAGKHTLFHHTSTTPTPTATTTTTTTTATNPHTPITTTTINGSRDLVIFTDVLPAELATDLPRYHLKDPAITMTFAGKISGAAATVGTDTFAGGPGYIHPTFVAANRLFTRPHAATVVLGDGATEVQCTEECGVYLQLGAFTTKVWLLVLSIPEPFDVLLGDVWLRQHGVRLLYDKLMMEVITPKRRFTVKSIHAPKTVSYTRKPAPIVPPVSSVVTSHVPVLSTVPECDVMTPDAPSTSEPSDIRTLNYHQFKRSYKKGHQLVLCVVYCDGPVSVQSSPVVDHPDLSETHKKGLQSILDEFSDVFGDVLVSTGPVQPDMPEVVPIIPGSKIPNRPLYRYSPLEQAEIERQVQIMLQQKLIEPSTSPYGAPVLLVKKPDGSWRFCVDFRALNAVTVKNGHPLPRIDDLLDKLQGARYFTSMDLLQGFWQLPLLDSDKPKTAFKTAFGHYQFRVVPMGLSNSPSVFQRVMNKVFAKQLNKYCLVYMDDILVFSKTPEEHLAHLRDVLSTIRECGLSVKTKKCHFFQQQLKFLGHIVSKDGISPDPDKVKVVTDWPELERQSDVRAFLGLTTYFKRFIRNYAKIAAPLFDLTRADYKKVFKWEAAEKEAFKTLKTLLSTAPLLAVPDFSKPFTLVTDASLVGLGGVLLQDDRPCAFESKKLSHAEVNYTTTEREMFATVYCYQKWAVYLRHNPDNVIITDHMPNIYFQSKPQLSSREVRWYELLSSFPGKWVYKPGKTNIADPLSRMPSFYLALLVRKRQRLTPSTPTFTTAPGTAPTLLDSIRAAYAAEPDFPKEKYAEHDGVFYYKDRIVVPNCRELRDRIVSECHSSMFAGHMGRDKTLHTVSQLFYWKNMAADVHEHVSQCHVCQTVKPGPAQQGLLQPLDVAERPWANISVDLITGLPITSSGHSAILVVVDRCTKMIHLIPCLDTLDAVGFAQLMQDHVFSKHGLPLDIVHDRDRRFTGNFFKSVCEHLNIHQSITSAYHPQSDGQTERMNRTVEQVLRAFTADYGLFHQRDWDSVLSMVEFAINNSVHAGLKHTPFFLNTGQHPITPIMLQVIKDGKTACAQALRHTTSQTTAFTAAMRYLQAARDRYKSYADAGKVDATFNIGDQVLLSTVNLNKHNQARKLYPKYVGPFIITSKVNDVAYKLDLPASMPVHPVFHVSLLKAYVAGKVPAPPPVPFEVEGELEYEVEAVWSHRVKKVGRVEKKDYYVKWMNYGPEHCTWEPEAHLKNAPACVAAYWKKVEADNLASLQRKATMNNKRKRV